MLGMPGIQCHRLTFAQAPRTSLFLNRFFRALHYKKAECRNTGNGARRSGFGPWTMNAYRPRSHLVILSLALAAFAADASAAITTYTDPDAFAAATTIQATATFDTFANNTPIANGASISGTTYRFNVAGGFTGLATSNFRAVSPPNTLGVNRSGLDLGKFFFAGDAVTLTFSRPVQAVGAYFSSNSAAGNAQGFISVSTAVGTAFSGDALPAGTFGFGANVLRFVGITSDQPFTAATLAISNPSPANVGFVVDNIMSGTPKAPGGTLQPGISSISPSSGTPGTPITMIGHNLGCTGSVKFGSAPAAVFSWCAPGQTTTNKIVAMAPVMRPGTSVPVTVTTQSGSATSTVSFTYTAESGKCTTIRSAFDRACFLSLQLRLTHNITQDFVSNDLLYQYINAHRTYFDAQESQLIYGADLRNFLLGFPNRLDNRESKFVETMKVSQDVTKEIVNLEVDILKIIFPLSAAVDISSNFLYVLGVVENEVGIYQLGYKVVTRPQKRLMLNTYLAARCGVDMNVTPPTCKPQAMTRDQAFQETKTILATDNLSMFTPLPDGASDKLVQAYLESAYTAARLTAYSDSQTVRCQQGRTIAMAAVGAALGVPQPQLAGFAGQDSKFNCFGHRPIRR